MKWKSFAFIVGGAILVIYAIKISRAIYLASGEKNSTDAVNDLLTGV